MLTVSSDYQTGRGTVLYLTVRTVKVCRSLEPLWPHQHLHVCVRRTSGTVPSTAIRPVAHRPSPPHLIPTCMPYHLNPYLTPTSLPTYLRSPKSRGGWRRRRTSCWRGTTDKKDKATPEHQANDDTAATRQWLLNKLNASRHAAAAPLFPLPLLGQVGSGQVVGRSVSSAHCDSLD